MPFRLNLKHLLYFTLAFTLAVPIGTQTHELGHIAMAQAFGYSTTLSYDRMFHDYEEELAPLNAFMSENYEAIEAGDDFPGKAEFEEKRHAFLMKEVWISSGGPIQTCLTGIIGLIILYIRRKKRAGGWQFIDWFAVFLALFWLREPFNLATAIADGLLKQGRVVYWGGDEHYIAQMMDWPLWSVGLPLGLIGAMVGLYVFFKVLPKQLRLTFLLSGLAGSAIGWLFWMEFLGPILLPIPVL